MNGATIAEHGLLGEPILDPHMAIVDAHHHLWDHGTDCVEQATEVHLLQSMSNVRRRYLLPEFVADLDSGHRVVATVYVQSGQGFYDTEGPEALRPVGETRFARAVGEAARDGPQAALCAAIVGYADLSLGDDVAPVLEAHIEAGGGRFRGIRNGMAWDADPAVMGPFAGRPGLYASDSFREGLGQLARLGLSFDAWLIEPQLTELLDLARAFPDLPIILGHLGAPVGIASYAGRQAERFTIWRARLREIAACSNVMVKLGGLGMPLAGLGSFARSTPCSSAELAQLWFPYFEVCIEAFGPDRCMFESNFPADAGSGSYPVLWNAFKRSVRHFSEDERAMLFHGTASRTYRLPTVGEAGNEAVEIH